MGRKSYGAGLVVVVCAVAFALAVGATKGTGKQALTEADIDKTLQQHAAAWFSGERERVVSVYALNAIASDSAIPPLHVRG